MAETAELPRISLGRWKGAAHPGDGPVFWRCNRCGHTGDGCANDNAAYREAAEHECPRAEDVKAHTCPATEACGTVEEIIAQGGNGEGWTVNDAILAARVGQGKGLHAADLKRIKAIMGDQVNVPVLPDGSYYE